MLIHSRMARSTASPVVILRRMAETFRSSQRSAETFTEVRFIPASGSGTLCFLVFKAFTYTIMP